MNRWTVLLAVVLFSALLAMGCSGTGGNPVTPDNNLTNGNLHGAQTQTHLWGYWDIYIDIANQKVEAVMNRSAMFTANVVTFVNKPATNLSFAIYGTPVAGDYIDVDIDVSMTHPFPGLTQYNGYDVRGVFIGAGSSSLTYDPGLIYALHNGDQEMYDYNDKETLAYTDPYGDELVGMPDGYTRWFNAVEFPIKGVLGYTQGKLATPNYQANLTATLNPYKYFADGIGPTDNMWDWVNANPDTRGVFTAGSTNTRNYYLRFPNVYGVNYGYSVVASWKGEAPEDHPANAQEAIALSVGVTPSLYFVNNTDKGGDLILDVDLWGWDYQPSTIFIESSVLGAPHQFDATEMTPVGGNENYSTYHVDIPADGLAGADGNTFWVIPQYDEFDYTCEFTPPGGAPGAPLAAFFLYDLYVSPVSYCPDVTVTSIDLDPPNGLTKPLADVYTGVEIKGGGFQGVSTCTVQLQGTSNIDATNVASNGSDTITCDLDLSATSYGDKFDVYVENECGKFATLIDAVEISMAFDIVQWDGSPLGGGPFAVTVKGADSTGDNGLGGPVPVHGNFIIDLAVRTNDGGVYIAWAEHKAWDNNKDYGYVDRYAADMLSVPANIPCFQYGANDPLSFSYRDFQLDCGTAGTSYPNGWGAEFLNAHIATNENMTPDAGYGPTLATWDYWGIAYGNPPYTYGRCVGATSSGTGHVYTYCAKNGVRIYGWVPGNGLWDFWQAYLAGQLGYSYGSDTYDDGSAGEVYAVAIGGTPVADNFFGLRYDSPHVVKYSSIYAIGTTTSWGADGTATGQIKNPIDMSIRTTANRIYVLDEPQTGYTRLQCFDTSGNILAASDTINTAPDGGSAPYRMDYNEFDDCIYVLYDNNTIEAWIDNSI